VVLPGLQKTKEAVGMRVLSPAGDFRQKNDFGLCVANLNQNNNERHVYCGIVTSLDECGSVLSSPERFVQIECLSVCGRRRRSE
jgi:hypothetical protein